MEENEMSTLPISPTVSVTIQQNMPLKLFD